MIEQGDEHGGNAIQCRAALLFHRGHNHQRIEPLQDDQGGAVIDRRQHAQHAAEAVKQRYGQTDPVFCGKMLVFTDKEAVVADIVMGQHDPLGKPGGPRGILHVDDIVRRERSLPLPVFLLRYHDAERLDFCERIHASVFLHAEKTDTPEVGEAAAYQPPALHGLQFRNKFIDGVDVVGVLVAVDEKKVLGLRLPEQVFELGAFIVGVDGEEHRADLGGGKLQGDPVRDIGCPDGDFFPFLHTERHQPPGHFIDSLLKLSVSQAIIPVDVDDCVAVGMFHDCLVKDLPQRKVSQRTYIFTHGAPTIPEYRSLHGSGLSRRPCS